MAKTAVALIALVVCVAFIGAPVLHAQGKQTVADLKIEYPNARNTDKATFTLDASANVNITVSIPLISGANKAYIGLINFTTKEEVWGITVDASNGPLQTAEPRTLKAGTYRLLYEFGGEPEGSPKAHWSGMISVMK